MCPPGRFLLPFFASMCYNKLLSYAYGDMGGDWWRINTLRRFFRCLASL